MAFFGSTPNTATNPFFGEEPQRPAFNPFFISGVVLEAEDGGERLMGSDKNDILIGGAGDDILRGGAGVDVMYGRGGNDTFVIVGDLRGARKPDTPEDTDVLGESVSGLNGQDFNEDADGGAQIIDGGSGTNTLYVYGTADLSNSTITNVQHIEIRSDVTFNPNQFDTVTTVNGDGRSVLRIESVDGNPHSVDLSGMDLSNIGQIEVGDNVTLLIDSLDDLGGARVLTGEGTIRGKGNDSIVLPASYAVEDSLTVEETNGDNATGAADILDRVVTGQPGQPIENTHGNDYLVGTELGDIFVLDKGGNDVVSARGGDDIFLVSGTGTKTLIATDGKETINLSEVQRGPAMINLTDGGKIAGGADQGGTTIQLGTRGGESGAFQDAPNSNVMLILDVSGSMGTIQPSGSTRLEDMQKAANDLFDAYENLGETAVRLIAFESSADSEFPSDVTGGAWMEISTARTIIDQLTDGGGTNYVAALNEAIAAHASGRASAYLDNARDQSFFLSDGEPNPGLEVTPTLQQEWHDFLIAHQITSNAIGFGGLNNVDPLRPIAFDGVTGQSLEPLLEVDSSQLGQVITEQAGLDFIEDLTGTQFDDELTGNSLDNLLFGGNGNDLLDGRGGNNTLIGADGEDVFVLGFAGNSRGLTTITDLTLGEDSLAFDTRGLLALAGDGTGMLDASAFFAVTDETAMTAASENDALVRFSVARDSAQLSTGESQGAVKAYVLTFNTDTQQAEIWYDNNWQDASSGREQIAALPSISTLLEVTGIDQTDIQVIDMMA